MLSEAPDMSKPKEIMITPELQAENFRNNIDLTVTRLISWENQFATSDNAVKEIELNKLRTELNFNHVEDPGEQLLFSQLFSLFGLKHQIGEANQILHEQIVNRPKENRVIGFLAALGNGKTTIAESFANDLNTEVFTHEPFVKNPYRAKSEGDKSYMLRSQLYFLFSNIFSDIGARLKPGVMISDSSTLTDIFMWVETYRQMGLMSEEEYTTYNQLVDLLKLLILKPDLLITLLPSSIDDLKAGVEERIKAKPEERASEAIFLENGNLEKQVKIVEGLSRTIPEQWDVPTLIMTVNPVEIFRDKPNYAQIYQIRKELGILGDLLNPAPEAVAEEALQILAESSERQIVIIHSKSMFSGKTTAECLLAKKVGVDKVVFFQPTAAIRANETGFEDQAHAVISRDGLKINANTIENNNLWSIVDYIKDHKIDPENQPYIFIDEIMLFTAHDKKPKDAIAALEAIRKMGFHVIVDGIDYTFQEEPFTFMDGLLKRARKNKHWYQIETSTRCCYCGNVAQGTRLSLVDQNSVRKIAPYDFDWNHPGSMDFEPVCCKEHKSCENQPQGFKRKNF